MANTPTGRLHVIYACYNAPACSGTAAAQPQPLCVVHTTASSPSPPQIQLAVPKCQCQTTTAQSDNLSNPLANYSIVCKPHQPTRTPLTSAPGCLRPIAELTHEAYNCWCHSSSSLGSQTGKKTQQQVHGCKPAHMCDSTSSHSMQASAKVRHT